MLFFFPTTLVVPIKYKFFSTSCRQKTITMFKHTAPNTASRRDTHTVGTSPTTNGVAKSRLACAELCRCKTKTKSSPARDFRRSNQVLPDSSPGIAENFRGIYSLLNSFPRVKADLTSAFLIAWDSGDDLGTRRKHRI